MLRVIWHHPEFPTKEDIRDELRSDRIDGAGLIVSTFRSCVDTIRKVLVGSFNGGRVIARLVE